MAHAASAFNNLAQTYMDQKRYHLAAQTIIHAIELDSSSGLYHQTWAEILHQEHSNPS